MFVILYSCISEDNHDRLLNSFLCKLPLDFQKNILSYRRWQDVQLRLLGRLLLINGLKSYGKNFNELIIQYSKYGKPYFKGSNIKFNISHSGDIVVCVITDFCEIGIDIEEIKDIYIDDYKNQFSEKEFVKIEESKIKHEYFFKFWTRKEAVIKANGMGISIPLNSFEVINSVVHLNENLFYLNEIKIAKNYVCNIAVEKRIKFPSLKAIRITY